jgi:uncharacterized delta-60 repeat protein
LNRYNSNGSLDTGFTPIQYDLSNRFNPDGIGKLEVQPNGKIYVSGANTFLGPLFRLNSDGTRDTSFESPVLGIAATSRPGISDFMVKSDGKLIISGAFNGVNGTGASGIGKLNTDGSFDTQFNYASSCGAWGGQLQKFSNDKYIVVFYSNVCAILKYVRFNADDTEDSTFTTSLPPLVSSPGSSSKSGFAIDGQDRIVTSAYRLNYDGSADSTYNSFIGINAGINLLAKQNDGKIIAIGDFVKANSIQKKDIVRLNPDGTTDNTFDAGLGFNYLPSSIAVQPDNKILVGGYFTTVNGATKTYLARLNADGSLDTTFNSTVNNTVKSIVVLPSGKILIGGSFTAFSGVARVYLARLNADGSLDTTFSASITSSSYGLYSILLQSDGKIMIGGNFYNVGGVSQIEIARLNPDGSLDTTFHSPLTSNTFSINQVLQQNDGKYLIRTNDTIKKLNNDGSLDNSFQTPIMGNPYDMFLQSDGMIYVGGSFSTSGSYSRYNLIRLKSDGSLDVNFLKDGADKAVNTIIGQPDGKIIVGGNFYNIGGIAKGGIARINNSPFVQLFKFNFDFDGDGKSDFTVYRPSNQFWYGLNSSNSAFTQYQFGATGDILAPADYNFDGKCDLGIFRNGEWWYQAPNGQHTSAAVWGQAGDKPIPSDWDGDGKTDFIVFRPSNGVWYRLSSGTGQMSFIQFGIAEDIPLQADFDGDGKSDVAVYRPSTGTWYWLNSSNNQFAGVPFGAVGDKPQTGDFDGDGKTDLAVYRPSNGYWYFLYSGSNYSFGAIPFGISEDRPTVADYDGDGKTDIAVFRPSTGTWYVLRSQAGFMGIQFGTNGDIPIPSAYYP